LVFELGHPITGMPIRNGVLILLWSEVPGGREGRSLFHERRRLDELGAQGEILLVKAGQGYRHGVRDQVAEPLAQDAPAAEDPLEKRPVDSRSISVSLTSNTSTEGSPPIR
jgi:hypothetical protein